MGVHVVKCPNAAGDGLPACPVSAFCTHESFVDDPDVGVIHVTRHPGAQR